ncbi:1-deoxy-D-xylulose 5-phosphate reductoisomerase [Polymorphobacter multimanifer]|uniref:1-deoxy-D-xylulose 5-phosphate reductoisomerase n=1 Tax=Polymorphobacter multimanifer TaxID=1070431 RepID=A0A841L7Q9_9SPHN|nr:1-deoxy-D-xylulose-5-phosphate reductoisomerase [Polymorphobacter multimanifer]MBB6225895.1 1-deoxy-D-xylulose-5-phosphate reductoisomerase [Polymorphobacter multimanifer]GGI74418.1 1-deoxy-D-xylulose 5-phosphate reductoisomerase [Polymorphobacter multimanifer]
MTTTLTILGATGSVGSQTLDLVARNPGRWQVEALTANGDAEGLARAALACGARYAAVGDEQAYAALKAALAGSGVEVAAGAEAIRVAGARPADIVLTAIVGAAGLPPTLAAIERGARIAIANKETLVCAGPVVTAAAKASGAVLLPVDSEHNAIFQVFPHGDCSSVRKVILTASGGPFRTRSLDEMRHVSVADACAHPVWSMGAKISIDSATLMNKGLELIEAEQLFGVGADRLGVIVHPQSVVHSMVEYVDGSVLAQMGTPDMRIPIAYALAWPERIETPCARLDLARIGNLSFEEPDLERFPALALAWAALRAGGSAPCILNAANEVAVAAFIAGKAGFLDIADVVAAVLDRLGSGPLDGLEAVLAADAAARAAAHDIVKGLAR